MMEHNRMEGEGSRGERSEYRGDRGDSRGDSRGERGDSRGGHKGGKFRKRVCRLCADTTNTADHKKSEYLVKFVSNKGKILPRRLSGSCAKHQRVIAKVIKRARAAGFMPYTAR